MEVGCCNGMDEVFKVGVWAEVYEGDCGDTWRVGVLAILS